MDAIDMAGDWMKVEKVTIDKPEIEAMGDSLSMDPDLVFAKCFRVWRWFDDHTVDGNATSVTKSAVDRRAGVTGFADAMEKVGWLVVDPHGVSLPRFDRHNGETSKQRALTAKRVASHKRKGNDSTNGAVTETSLPREEKRREEPPPPTPATSVDHEWAEAAAELLKVGVGTAESVLLGCRRRDVQPIDVRRVLSHWRAKAPAWEVGGLVYRLANLRHGQDPADPNLWPPPSKAAKQSETTADRERVAAEAKRQRDEGEQRKREAAEHAKRLERDHGPATNKLDRAAMEAILNKRMKNWRRLYHLPDSGKLTEGAIRHELLCHFDSQAVTV